MNLKFRGRVTAMQQQPWKTRMPLIQNIQTRGIFNPSFPR